MEPGKPVGILAYIFHKRWRTCIVQRVLSCRTGACLCHRFNRIEGVVTVFILVKIGNGPVPVFEVSLAFSGGSHLYEGLETLAVYDQ